jgi:hypothetical protein
MPVVGVSGAACVNLLGLIRGAPSHTGIAAQVRKRFEMGHE